MIIKTKYPLCVDSMDYINPVGAVNDDNCNPLYVDEVISLFNHPISYLELGCAGGTIVDYLVSRGHDAYGIDGTDHPIKIGRTAWKKHHNTRLFTCDLSKPFDILESPKFDVISAWEFMEHLPPKCINYLMAKLYKLLKEDGIILFGISSVECSHHLSVFTREIWEQNVFSELFDTHDYNLTSKYREDYIGDHKSFFVILKPKKYLEEKANIIIENFEKNFV
jgi:2-polyprenyl-3-methyl-5-hydroxy-6-metoxy-1,4-benzoquinol methylase